MTKVASLTTLDLLLTGLQFSSSQSARTAFGVRRNGLTDSIFYKTKLDNLERMSELEQARAT